MSGASSAQSGRETRGALKRFSQSGTAADGELVEPVFSVMAPFCARPPTPGPLRPQPVENPRRAPVDNRRTRRTAVFRRASRPVLSRSCAHCVSDA
ncbi:hypothetical protein GCM10023082_26070 [Streptomyces tremellae]|uniref:Uncharacterized protein n=1 Tax=Streptomyces tremellae TaxID=1124239 RepID=A0ABP7EYX4_9ACTN